MHVRRPNSHDSRIAGADIPDEVYLSIINKLRIKYADKKPLFHLYTQGFIENFDCYKAEDAVIHINDSVEYAFTAMVLADVIVVAPSALSFVAALLSDGDVYHLGFGFRVPNWILVDEMQ